MWATLAQSVAKPCNDYFGTGADVLWRNSEDRYRLIVSSDQIVAGVADGAGSCGLFCGAWAQRLLNHLPTTPSTDHAALNRWLDGCWENFYQEFKQQAAPDPAKHSKFVREGSFSTLIVCWLSRRNDGVSMHWLGYGDSPLYVFVPDEDGITLDAGHPSSLMAFERAPHLLNWKELPNAEYLRTGTLDLPPRATVVVASDGIGQFVVLRYLSHLYNRRVKGDAVKTSSLGGRLLAEFQDLITNGASGFADLARVHLTDSNADFARDLATLRASLKTEDAFAEMIRRVHEGGLAANDDASLIMIDVDVRLSSDDEQGARAAPAPSRPERK